jgi:hypothetical protein
MTEERNAADAAERKNQSGMFRRSIATPERWQTFFNGLLTLFTGVLVFLTVQTERPYVVPGGGAISNFAASRQPIIRLELNNIGHTPAHRMQFGLAMGILPYPLGRLELEKVPATSIPVELAPNTPIGAPGTFGMLTRDQFNAVRDGTAYLFYIWGTIQYQGFLPLWTYSEDFCFAFGGTDMDKGLAGVCAVSRTGQHVLLNFQQEPQTEPNTIPARPTP